RGVDVEAEVAEEAQDGAVRVRLHRVAQREPEGVREGERRARRGLERRAVVDVARRAEALAHQGRLGRGEEHGAQRIIRGRANANGTRPTSVEPNAVDAATQRIVRVEPGAMATLRFAKLHGTANDFIYVDARAGFPGDPAALATRLCHRRRGIGADGLILLLPASTGEADCRMAIYNADGSRAEMCGNGIRGLAKFVRDRGLVGAEPLRVNTEFVRPLAPERLEMRVWERGAGETMACGTGACAAAVAAARTGRSGRRVVVALSGGELDIDWRLDDRVLMTGDAVEVFEGQV